LIANGRKGEKEKGKKEKESGRKGTFRNIRNIQGGRYSMFRVDTKYPRNKNVTEIRIIWMQLH
jgi:hypothetical protein